MNEEMESLFKNKTWQLVDRPKGQRTLGCKWMYKLKEVTSDKREIKYKARLVAKGFAQIEGLDSKKYIPRW